MSRMGRSPERWERSDWALQDGDRPGDGSGMGRGSCAVGQWKSRERSLRRSKSPAGRSLLHRVTSGAYVVHSERPPASRVPGRRTVYLAETASAFDIAAGV